MIDKDQVPTAVQWPSLRSWLTYLRQNLYLWYQGEINVSGRSTKPSGQVTWPKKATGEEGFSNHNDGSLQSPVELYTERERRLAGPLRTRAIMQDETTKIWEHIRKNLLSRGMGEKEEGGRQPRGTNDSCTRTGTHQKINTGWGPPPHTALERVTHVRGWCKTQARTTNMQRYNQVDGLAGTMDRDSSKSGGEQTR